jgi:hypothetical protein
MELRGFAVLCALCPLVIGSGGCLLFTDTFNKPPQVSITGPDADTVFVGESKRVAATVVDDGDGGTFDWGIADGDCPATLSDAMASRRSGGFFGDQATFDLPRANKPGPACVFVIVTDRAGAASFGAKRIDVKNRTLVIHRPSTIERNKPAAFSAAFVSDPSGADDPDATMRGAFAWGRDRTCADAEKAARAATPRPAGSAWTLDLAPRRAFCVFVVASDENHVEVTGNLTINDIVSTGPAAVIRIVEPATPANPMGLFTNVRLSGADMGDSSPEDATNFVWTLTRPGAMPVTMPAAELAFSTDTAGVYRVGLTITEDGTAATATPLELTAEDAPPCIRETEPSFTSAPQVLNRYDQPRTFRVTQVDDDGDPVPFTTRPNLGAFVWSTRLVGAEAAQPQDFQVRAGSLQELVLPARLYQPDDRVQVRVEYLDRRDLLKPRDLHCEPDGSRCEVAMGSM